MSSDFFTPFEILRDAFGVILQFFGAYWWIILPPALFFIFRDFWLDYRRTQYVKDIPWALLEVKVPAEVVVTPKAMEQIFAGLYAISKNPNFVEKYWQGFVLDWISFELFGNDEGVGFYVRTPTKFRPLVETQIYSQYPQAEIVEVEDYVKRVEGLPTANHDMWGTEMILAKNGPETAYPIRTYPYFESTQKELRLDPLTSLVETMSHLEPGEELWLQLLIRPAGDDWVKDGCALVDTLIGKKKKTAGRGFFEEILEFITNFLKAPFEYPAWATTPAPSEGPETLVQFLSPGQKGVVEAIERKVAQLGYHTGIRWLYHGNRDVFSKNGRSRIAETLSYFRHFSTQDMNAFKPNKLVTPSIDYWFKARREYSRKRGLFDNYQKRKLPRNASKDVLCIEELATIYHPPLTLVKAPKLRRLEVRKGVPPPTLPVEE